MPCPVSAIEMLTKSAHPPFALMSPRTISPGGSLDAGSATHSQEEAGWVRRVPASRFFFSPRHVGGTPEIRNRPSARLEDPKEYGRFPPHIPGTRSARLRQVPAENREGVPPRRWLLLLAERLALAIGLIGLGAWGWHDMRSTESTRHDLEQFAAVREVAPARDTPLDGAADRVLWSPTRISAWRKAVSEPGLVPLAVLRIPRVRLEVPVLPGTDDLTLDRGVGHIAYTVQPGTDGNSAIAGHRDSFFRGLKDIAIGDLIELDTKQESDVYRVERTWIVNPEDVSVLDPTPMRALTLVTCYPFYLCRLRSPAVHRPCSACERQTGVLVVITCDRPVRLTFRNRSNFHSGGECYDTCNEEGGSRPLGILCSDSRRGHGADDRVDRNQGVRGARGRWKPLWSSACRKARGS